MRRGAPAAARRSGTSARRPSPAPRRPAGPGPRASAAVASTEPGAAATIPGARARTAAASPAAEATVVSGSRPAQMSAIGDRVRAGERIGEGVEQRGRPVVGQRLVDGPDAPARLALADRGERLPDRRRVVAVVVVDDDAARLALALEPAADALERGDPGGDRVRAPCPAPQAAAATPSAFAALWRPARATRRASSAAPGSSPSTASSVPSRPRRRTMRPVTSAAPSSAVPTTPPRPVAPAAPTSSATPASATFATSTGRAGSPPGRSAPPDPRLERVEHRRAVGEDVGVVPLGRGEHDHVRPIRRRSCRRTRPPRRRTAPRRPAAPSPAPRRPSATAGRSAPTKAPGSSPPAARTWTSHPDVVLFPWVPATRRASGPRPRPRRPAATPPAGCRRRAPRRARGGRGRSP